MDEHHGRLGLDRLVAHGGCGCRVAPAEPTIAIEVAMAAAASKVLARRRVNRNPFMMMVFLVRCR
ncbi:hypothetical protein ABZ807_19440 [Micromonospora sp. NPDC047548]|uniref:hypothetical protein n=1 Tax=Micromonospora sp. NPDC047548 TaxID=3155624 RepID=UPI00340E5968